MDKFSIVIFILTILISLSALIEKIKIPHPVFFVVAGLSIGFIPGLPDLVLDPQVVFVLFLPPLLYDAAFRTSWRDFKTDIRPIAALAVSLVFFTTVAIAITAYFFIPGFSWPLAFLLGAIVSPPDAVAATGIIRGIGLNRRVITILEGESLVNDASALIAYYYALTAVATGSFVLWQAGLHFFLIVGGGIGIGLSIGYALVQAHRKIRNNPSVETGLTMLTPFLSYLAAEQIHVSGILAVVSTGLFLAWHSHEIFLYQTRMRSRAVWDTLMFLLNGFVFILIGMQLPSILQQLARNSFAELALYGGIISIVTIVVRIFWVFGAAYLAKVFKRKRSQPGGKSSARYDESIWKNVLIISWSGTRGVISLAAALAIPLTLSDGTAFPQRSMILFLCFVVIFVTLVVQGLSLQPLVKMLKVKPVTGEEREASELRLFIVNSTLNFIDDEFAPGTDSRIKTVLKKKYEDLAGQLTAAIETHREHDGREEERPIASLTSIQEVRIVIGKFQRELLLKLHKEGLYSSKAIRQVEEIMDINELQFVQQIPDKDLPPG